MADGTNAPSVREAVAVFDDAPALEAAIDELLQSGFDRAELSLLAGEAAVEEKLGHLYTKVSDLEDDPDVPRAAYVSTESVGDAEGGLIGGPLYVGAMAAAGTAVAAGGSLAAVIAAAASGGSAAAAIGVALAVLVGRRRADHLQEQIDRGGLLLWVRTRDPEHEKRASEILARHSAHDVHVHDVPAGS